MKTPAGRTLGGWLAACAGATQMMAASGSVTLLDPSSGVVVPSPQVSFRAQVSDPAGLRSATLYLGAVGEAPTTLTFSGPAQTEDTYLDAGMPTSAFGNGNVLLVDAATPHAHAVIKFSTLIGNSPGQVPPGSSIQSATLRVNCINLGNPLRIYRLVEDWVESEATWNQRSVGVPWSNLGADGLLSHAATELSGDCSATGWRTIDVTTFVQDWSLGQANYGLVLIDSGIDGIDLDSSESLKPPELAVTFGSPKQAGETVLLSGAEQTVAFAPVQLTDQQNYVWNCLLENELGEQTWAPADVQFTVDANYPDAPVLVAPANGMVGVSTSPELQVLVSDPNGDTLSVSFYGRPKVNDAEEFVVVALPDTQYYSRDYPQIFADQTTWIKNYKAQSNIVFVTHEGDVVNDFNSILQFDAANAALSVLDGVVPYGLLPGNHDTPTTLFNQYFPYTRFEYDGSTQAGHYAGNNDNNYHLFSAGGQDFIVLQLQVMPPAEVITWADSILKAYPDRKAIITTHAYLDSNGARYNPNTGQSTEYIWTDLVVPNPNVFFVLCGHVHAEYARTDVVDGREVHQLLADYQSEAYGGNGWLRMLRFKPSLDQVWVETYSPWLDQYQTDANSYFARNFPMNGFRLIARQDAVTSGSSLSTAWSNLEMNRDYEWRVVVTDSTGRTTTGPTWQFKTADPVPPAIYFVAASEVTETSTRIVWVTDEPATSVVDYGLDASHGTTVSNLSLVTDHSITLSGLTANTTYLYSVTSEDESGNPTSSSGFTFTTLRVNHAPVAVAQSVSTNEDVALNITLSGSDEDGDVLAYSVTSPPQYGTLTGSAPNITYTPAPNYYGGDSFQFEVNDGSATGGPATVSITVMPVNDPPMANAGPDQAADQNQMVTLDGSGSIDIDGPTLTYQWRQIPGTPSVALNNPSAAQPTFLAPPVVEETALVFELTVSDGIFSSVDTTVVTVIPVDYDAYVEEAVLTLGTVAGGIEGTRLANDGLTQSIVEASDRGGASFLIEYRLNTVAVPDQVSSMVLYLAAAWNPQDAGEPLYVGLNNVTTGGWEDISTLAQNGSFTVTAPEKYIDVGGDIRVRFFDGANVKREKKDTLTVDLLFADIEVGPPDIEPPAPPIGLSAVGGEYLVHLSWAPNAETDLAGYFVYRAAVSGGPYARLNASPIAATAFDDTGVLPGDPFYYVVAAVDSSGNESKPSGEANASSNDEAPSAPTGLTAVAGNGQVTLDWADNPEPDVVGYRAWRSLTSGGGYAEVGAGVIAESAFGDSGLLNGTAYYYLVTAVDALGHESPNSVEVSATPQEQMFIRVARIDMYASAAGKNWKATAQVTVLQQNDAPAAGATVVGDWYLGTGLIQAGATVLTDGSGSALFTSPPAKVSSGTFKFQVSNVQLAGAIFDAGQSVMSGAINVPLAPPAAPASLTASPVATTQISLTWADQSNNELQFRLERSTDGFTTVAEIILAANATQYTDTGLAPGTSYSYRLRACNDPGCSAYSNVAIATTPIPPPPPAAPGDLTAVTVASTQIRLAWIDQSDNESQFRLERSTDGFASVVERILAAGTTQYLDTGLAEGVTYSYRLRACNDGGCSGYSGAATAGTGIVVGPWTPLFMGIEHATGLTTVATSPRQVVNVLRVDLQDPNVQLFSTPPSTDYVPDVQETTGLTTSHFLVNHGLQVAINGNWFSPCCTGTDGVPEELLGLAISSSVVVSDQESDLYSTAMVLTSDKAPTMIGTNWPATNTSGFNTAVAGKNPLLYRGVYVGTNVLVDPRTAMGVTEDKRYLLLMTIDGRQTGYSVGAADADTAAWMARFGAYDAFNLDGGGSTTMVTSDGQGGALVLNQPIHNNVPGSERAVANHLGVYAQPLGVSPLTSLAMNSRIGLDPAAEPLFQAIVNQMVDPTPDLMVTRLGAGRYRISVRGTPDYTYRLQYSEGLNSPIWQPLATVRANEIGLVDYIDTHAAAPRYYRALNP